MNFERKSGILLHIISLPGRWGMGELGPQARNFGTFLSEAGQKLWQILPTGPVGYGYSPYSSLSAFAGNHLLISFDELIADGLLTEKHLKNFPQFDPHRIDFHAVISAREKILFRMADRFEPDADFTAFCVREADWLSDYALFMAIREAQKNRPWTEWPDGLRDRDFQALEKAETQLAKKIRRHEILQYLFSKHWKKTAEFFQTLDVSIIGDIPIFVAGDSADVWANRELFSLNDDGSPTVVAGVPPDYFSATGQRWGNPLYDWKAHFETGCKWWTRRMRRMLEMTDIVRIDHFRGFEAYWEIPAAEPTAIHGRWVKGPGLEFFQTLENGLRRSFGKTFRLAEHVIAENLGVITDEVEALRETCGFPGMWVLQFRFGAEPMARPGYRPEGVEKNWAVYTGTHDNDTTESWFQSLDDAEKHRVRICAGDGSVHRCVAELALSAPAKWAVLPMQDVLGLSGEARMNTPGTTQGNWGWRFSEDMISPDTVCWLRDAVRKNGR
ncbi:MAG: 4-alpha-glucanotransferase [Verrucomicrobia bacterium]|nr:4-alpha-glucanotransferase [Verrucomicrobiota bacterium]